MAAGPLPRTAFVALWAACRRSLPGARAQAALYGAAARRPGCARKEWQKNVQATKPASNSRGRALCTPAAPTKRGQPASTLPHVHADRHDRRANEHRRKQKHRKKRCARAREHLTRPTCLTSAMSTGAHCVRPQAAAKNSRTTHIETHLGTRFLPFPFLSSAPHEADLLHLPHVDRCPLRAAPGVHSKLCQSEPRRRLHAHGDDGRPRPVHGSELVVLGRGVEARGAHAGVVRLCVFVRQARGRAAAVGAGPGLGAGKGAAARAARGAAPARGGASAGTSRRRPASVSLHPSPNNHPLTLMRIRSMGASPKPRTDTRVTPAAAGSRACTNAA